MESIEKMPDQAAQDMTESIPSGSQFVLWMDQIIDQLKSLESRVKALEEEE